MVWRGVVLLEPKQGPKLSAEDLARICDEHLALLDAEQDAIYERIRQAREAPTVRGMRVSPGEPKELRPLVPHE